MRRNVGANASSVCPRTRIVSMALGNNSPGTFELVHGPPICASAQLWLGLQMDWVLYHAVHSAAAKEINKIKRRPL